MRNSRLKSEALVPVLLLDRRFSLPKICGEVWSEKGKYFFGIENPFGRSVNLAPVRE
jgi:hypothetical protein